jgi:predicted  nucleic acid-binding Zn-ribbon protein/DNA-directed RNA polymerase subunit RPC12/RpoP
MIAEIKFDCGKCGQRICVEQAAAGLASDCPTCGHTLTIPELHALNEREYDGPLSSSSRSIGEINRYSTGRHGDPEAELATAQEELAFLRDLLHERSEECSRLTASATHAQAEIKSFQAERRALKHELAAQKQRVAVLEAHGAELATDLEVQQQRASALEAHLTGKEQGAAELQARLDALIQEQDHTLRELESLQAESTLLRTSLDNSAAELEPLRAAALRLTSTESELQQTRQQLRETETARQSFSAKCETLNKEAKKLRKHLSATATGKELLSLRARLETTNDEHQRLTKESQQVADDLKKSESAKSELQSQLQALSLQLADAEGKIAASAESQVQKENDVLRGIVERQNAELEARFVEIHRYKRARFIMRSIYAACALVAIALVITAVKVLSTADSGFSSSAAKVAIWYLNHSGSAQMVGASCASWRSTLLSAAPVLPSSSRRAASFERSSMAQCGMRRRCSPPAAWWQFTSAFLS